MPTCPSPRRRRKDGELATLRAELAAVTLRPARCTVHRAPCTLYPAPYTLHPIPWQVHAARLEDAGALSAAVQQQQLQANASAPPATPCTASAPPQHRPFTPPSAPPTPWSQAIASSGEVVVQLEQRLQAVRLERVEEREAAAEAAAQAKAS